MKSISVVFFLLVVSVCSFGQQITPAPAIQTDYLQESRNQKTAGIILISGGGATFITGGILLVSGFVNIWDQNKSGKGEAQMNTGGALIVSGIVVGCSGIPFMVAANRNKKKAKLLSGRKDILIIPTMSVNKSFSAGAIIHF